MKKISLLTLSLFLFATTLLAQHATYSGNGDDVITLDKPDSNMPALLQIWGNSSHRHFAVKGYDSSGNQTELLVNTTKDYKGFVPVDLGTNSQTTRLEISASGTWSIDVYSIGSAQTMDVPGSCTGHGDDVLWVEGQPSIMELAGNQAGRNLAAWAYDSYGRRVKLLVNTTEPYNGKVIVPSETQVIEVSAVGSWNLSLE